MKANKRCLDCRHCLGAQRLAERLCIRCELTECCFDPDPHNQAVFMSKEPAVERASDLANKIIPDDLEADNESDERT